VLAVDARTLKLWQARWDQDRLAIQPLGAPACPISATARAAVVDEILLHALDGVPGARALHRLFPELPRRALEDILAHTRDRWHEEARELGYHQLIWSRPGTVWAIDFTFPPNPVDGDKPAILTVRDLASGCILLFTACTSAEAHHVVAHLEQLVAAYGAPLVLKADNGSHFTADIVSAFLQQHRITPLFSPAYTPAYNGAVEADQGALKAHTRSFAARDGQPFHWTSSHLEGALQRRNRSRGIGPHGDLPCPQQRFDNRTPITERYRDHWT
jgi:transposase InsO family protein